MREGSNRLFGNVVGTDTYEQQLLKLFDDHSDKELSLQDISRELKVPPGSFHSALTYSIRKGKIIRVRRGVYKLNSAWKGRAMRHIK